SRNVFPPSPNTDADAGAIEQVAAAKACPAKRRLVRRVVVLGRTPDSPGGVDNQAKLGPLRVLVDRIAAGDAGEAALRRDRQALDVDEARGLVDAPAQV